MANCSHFKDVLEYKAPMFQTHKHPFTNSDVVTFKSSLKLACFLLNRNLYIRGKYLWLFGFYGIFHSVNGAVLAELYRCWL